MRRTPLALTLAALAASAALAAPEPAPAADDCAEAIHRLEQAQDRVDIDLPPGWGAMVECSDPELPVGHAHDGTITFRPPPQWSVDQLEWVWRHELAHAWDEAVMGEPERAAWRELRGLEGRWLGGLGTDLDRWGVMPGEDFAEAFAHCSSDLDLWGAAELPPPTTSECGFVQYLTGLPMRR